MAASSKIILALMALTFVVFVSARPGGKQMTILVEKSNNFEENKENDNSELSRFSRSAESVEVEKTEVQSELDKTAVTELKRTAEETKETAKEETMVVEAAHEEPKKSEEEKLAENHKEGETTAKLTNKRFVRQVTIRPF